MPEEAIHPRRRGLSDALARAVDRHPLVLLEGPRGVGKTTLARTLISDAKVQHYVSLADTSSGAASQARQDPAGFVASLAGSTIIDDVHLVPGLVGELERATDRPQPTATFLAVGLPSRSRGAAAEHRPAGRVVRLRLGSMTQSELRGQLGRFVTAVFAGDPSTWNFDPLSLQDYLAVSIEGGLPAVALGPPAGVPVSMTYDALLGDVLRGAGRASDDTRARRVFRHVVSRPGGRVTLDRAADELGLAPASVLAEIDRLAGGHAIVRLEPWSRFRRASGHDTLRVFASDPAYCARVLDVTHVDDAGPQDAAVLMHALVAHELTNQNGWLRHPVSITFWRSRPAQFEVDFLLENDAGVVVPLAVTTSLTASGAELAGIDAFRRRHPRAFRRGVLLYPGDRVRSLGDERWAVPLSAMWTVAEAQAPLDVGSLEAELDSAASALRLLVERAPPADDVAVQRRAALEEAMAAALAPRLDRIGLVLSGLGLGVERLEVTELPPPALPAETVAPAWLGELPAQLGPASGPQAAVSLVGGLSISIGPDAAGGGATPGGWAALLIATLRVDGSVAWQSCHVLRSAAGIEGLAVVGLAGPVLSRFDAPLDGPVDQLSASLASTLPDAMARLAPAA